MTNYVASTTQFPYSAVVHIVTTYSDGSQSSGSGAIVGANDVLTAAHMVYEPGLRTTRVEVIPGQRGTLEPFGRIFPVSWDYFPVDTDGDGMLGVDESARDFAVLAFNRNIAQATGSFGWTWVAAATANLTGYPGRYGGDRMTNDVGSVSYDPIYGIVDISRLEVNSGNSGGPVWIAGNKLIGVVSTASWAAAVGGPYWNSVVGWMNANNSLLGGAAPPPLLANTPSEAGDVLNGNASNDSFDGRGGNDRINGAGGDDVLAGGAGLDTLAGGDGSDSLYGDGEADTLRGEAGDDWLYGGDDDDALDGGGGDDWLDGDGGADRISGGAGRDTFSVFATQGGDSITDFLPGFDVLRIGSADPDWDYSRVRLLGSQFRSGAGADRALDADDFVIYDTLTGRLYYDANGNRAGEAELLATFVNLPLLEAGDIWIPPSINLSTDGADRLIGGGLGETLDAGGGDDFVAGNDGADHLLGGDGDDALAGGNGADTLVAGNGNDSLDGGPDDDLLRGGAGDDLLYGDAGLDDLDGGAGNDTAVYFFGIEHYFLLRRGDGSVAIGFEAVDGVEPLRDIETLRFGGMGGSDLALAAMAANVGDAGRDIFYGTLADDSFDGLGGNDSIEGGGGDDSLAGGAGNDRIDGGSGDDSLDGGSGADRMSGGSGDDLYRIDHALDGVSESAFGGHDTVLTLLAAGNLGLMGQTEDLVYAGSGRFTGTGNALGNRLVGGSAADRLAGLAGDDTLEGGSGDDSLNGAAGFDTVILAGLRGDYRFARPGATTVQAIRRDGSETDLLTGIEQIGFGDGSLAALTPLDLLLNTASVIADNFVGAADNDEFDGLAGDDVLAGGDGNDTLRGGAGNDRIDGGRDADQLEGGLGNDVYGVDDFADVVLENAGQGLDRVRTSLPFYTLGSSLEELEFIGSGAFMGSGSDLANRIIGGAGSDLLQGFGGRDSLFGGDGDDYLDGGSGNDQFDGGSGDDTYILDHALDAIAVDRSGVDTVISNHSRSLGGGLDNLILDGTAAINGSGNVLSNQIFGNAAANVLSGFDGNDRLSGDAGNDRLVGGRGDDSLNGGDGRDVLLGEAGADRFVFDRLAASTAGADLVLDFVGLGASLAARSAGVDRLLLDPLVFADLVWEGGVLAAGQFRSGAGLPSAQTASERLLYDSRSGSLWYDADGVGGGEPLLVAVFGTTTHPALLAADFAAF